MIPVHLHISGFLSYLDPVEIDFSTFDVACISGANGAGKSSLLDAITWVVFGQARRKDDAIINSRAKSAEVILDLQYEGERYRVQRMKPRDKTAVLEFSIQTADGSWKPLTERSIRETELRIQQTLRMDYETFINASFFLQGKADLFAQQRPGDRKRILSTILGLEVWESYRAGAAERRKILEDEQTALEGQLSEIQRELSEEDTRRQRLQTLEEQLAQLADLRKAKETSMDALRRLAAALTEQLRLLETLRAGLGAARQRRSERAAELDARCKERETYRQRVAAENDVRLAYQNWQQARADLQRWDEVAASFRQVEQRRSAPVLAIETERSRLDQERQTLLAQERAINEAVERMPVTGRLIEESKQGVAALAARIDQRPGMENDLRRLMAEQGDAQAENRRLRDEMNELKERITRLKEIGGAVCPLCGQPLSTLERETLVNSLEASGREKGDRFRANQELVKTNDQRRQELETALAGLSPLENDLRRQQRSLDQLEDQLAQVETAVSTWQSGGAARLRALTEMLSGGDFALEARAELARVDAELKELGYDAAAHDAVRLREQQGRSSEEALRALEAARAALEPLEREIARLQEQLAGEETEVSRQEAENAQAEAKYAADAAGLPDLNQVERELFDLQEQENRLRYAVGGARQAVMILDVQRKRREEFLAQRAGLAQRIAQLKTLERAFGKDGVPALLIEQALPEIEGLANEILDRLSGGNMSVRFATQKDYKDKSREDKRETLDIIISDASGPREYELFSGGEAFRVNFAIRLALSRFLAQRAGARLQTLVIDEGFGSQDAEGRQRLIEAINMVRSDFAKILAITHMDELKDAFPVRLEVEKTPRGSVVRMHA